MHVIIYYRIFVWVNMPNEKTIKSDTLVYIAKKARISSVNFIKRLVVHLLWSGICIPNIIDTYKIYTLIILWNAWHHP